MGVVQLNSGEKKTQEEKVGGANRDIVYKIDCSRRSWGKIRGETKYYEKKIDFSKGKTAKTRRHGEQNTNFQKKKV